MSMQNPHQLYQLDQPAFQKAGTWQCWWLSLLEVARATDKLNSTFEEGGKLYAYYKTGGKSIPAEGNLPEDVNLEKPELEVYGPEWQRMIMFFLWDKSNECPWNKTHNTTCLTSQRKAELEKLLNYLGVTGITFGTPRSPIEANVSAVVNDGLANNQRVLVDKKNHAMSGIVESIRPEDSNQKAYNKIKVFNQQTQETFMCWVREHPEDKKLMLLSESGKTQLNWILPLILT